MPVEPVRVLDGQVLELRRDDGAAHYLLGGVRLRNGEVVEVLLAGGVWLRGEFAWSGSTARWPGLRCPLGGPWEDAPPGARVPMAVIALHPDARLRRV